MLKVLPPGRPSWVPDPYCQDIPPVPKEQFSWWFPMHSSVYTCWEVLWQTILLTQACLLMGSFWVITLIFLFPRAQNKKCCPSIDVANHPLIHQAKNLGELLYFFSLIQLVPKSYCFYLGDVSWVPPHIHSCYQSLSLSLVQVYFECPGKFWMSLVLPAFSLSPL